MQAFPATPSVSEAPAEVTESGHLWLLELVDGGLLRFSVDRSGLIRFGDADRTYADPDDLPPTYRAAVRSIREDLDRDALRAAVDDVEAVTFCGRATFRRSIAYEWARTPAFLGYDVWSGERWLPPDTAAGVYEALGLSPVHAFERELRARDFSPATDAVPESAYYDGPAAGVIVRNKAGGRARWRNADVIDREPVEDPVPDLDALVERFTAPATLRRIVGASPESVDRTTAIDRVIEAMYREAPHAIDGPRGIDEPAVRAAVARALETPISER